MSVTGFGGVTSIRGVGRSDDGHSKVVRVGTNCPVMLVFGFIVVDAEIDLNGA